MIEEISNFCATPESQILWEATKHEAVERSKSPDIGLTQLALGGEAKAARRSQMQRLYSMLRELIDGIHDARGGVHR